MRFVPPPPTLLALLGGALGAIGLFGPLIAGGGSVIAETGATVVVLVGLVLLLAALNRPTAAAALTPVALAAAFLPVVRLGRLDLPGGWGYWLIFWGMLLAVFGAVGLVSLGEIPADESRWDRLLRQGLPPATVPLVLLLTWQGLVEGYTVPKGIFPSVVDVYRSLTGSAPVLLADSYVTFVKEVLLGFVIGLSAGFVAGTAIAFNRFLQRGFLPLAAASGAVPIVGLAPVLGRAFGVDWESKAAVVVIVTFFPVVLNTVSGLVQVDPLKLELLRAYAAKPHEVFLKLRLPNALPYIFNALKLAVVISVISVIVAEFLIPGPPEGLGQRISLSARRGAYDVVFAAIFVSSVISIVLYGALSALERLLTSWHPSFREEGA